MMATTEGTKRIDTLGFGTHACTFYESGAGLLDVVVPYLKAGLESRQFCLWVSSSTSMQDDVRRNLERAVPDLETHLRSGALELIPHTQWHLHRGAFDLAKLMERHQRTLARAIARGFTGLRIGGDGSWVEPKDWSAFAEYEASLTRFIADQPTVALCAYRLDRGRTAELLDVSMEHPCAVTCRNGRTEIIESDHSVVAEIDAARGALRREMKQRSLAEGKLQRVRKHLITFMEHIPGLAWAKSLDGRYLYVNKTLLNCGVPCLGRRDDKIWGAELAGAYGANDARVLSAREALPPLVERWVLNGKERRMLVNRFSIPEAGGENFLLGGIGVDVTERFEAEERLHRSEERFRQLAESITEVFWMTDPGAGQTLYVSPGYERIWGRTCESLYAHPEDWRAAIHPDDQDAVTLSMATKQMDGAYDEEYRIIRPDGTVRWIRDRAFPILDMAGSAYRLARIAEDITNRKEAEKALEESHRRVQSLSASILKAQESERQHIARELHDEIGQSLTALKLRLQTMQRRSPGQHEEIEECVRIADIGITQVHSLSLGLRPSQLDELGLPAALRWHLDRQTRSLDLRAHFTCASVSGRLPEDLEIACFRIAQEALTNVLRHAQAREVWIGLRRRDAELLLSVRDDGRGFDLADARSKAVRGLALGLVGMQERVELVGGRLEMRSRPGAGTQIRAVFPLPSATHVEN